MINDIFATFAYSSIKGKWQKEKKIVIVKQNTDGTAKDNQ